VTLAAITPIRFLGGSRVSQRGCTDLEQEVNMDPKFADYRGEDDARGGHRMDIAEVMLGATDMLASLPRRDQRRWGETYIRGLLTVPGRKTVPKIASLVADSNVGQCLEQFVNQSTWRWEHVRRDVALAVCQELRPRAWVIHDVVLPKNGRHSVGVARQFADPPGRVVNCQLGIAVSLAGDGWSCPVTWRLLLPACWDADPELRGKAHVPDSERCVPRWQRMLDAIDELVAEWGLPAVPVLADMTLEREIEPLLTALEARGLSYAIRVSPSQPVPAGRPAMASVPVTFGHAIARLVKAGRAPVNLWLTAPDRQGRVSVVGVPLPGVPRYAVADWPPAAKSPRRVWVTSFGAAEIPLLIAGAALQGTAVSELAWAYDQLGLGHFEGRSFAGWHHHMTMVSVAAASRLVVAARKRDRGEVATLPMPAAPRGGYPAKDGYRARDGYPVRAEHPVRTEHQPAGNHYTARARRARDGIHPEAAMRL
jgi:SRSO17 transposase